MNLQKGSHALNKTILLLTQEEFKTFNFKITTKSYLIKTWLKKVNTIALKVNQLKRQYQTT